MRVIVGGKAAPGGRTLITAALMAVVLAAVTGGVKHPQAAGPCGPPVVNPVACENTNPGTPSSQWAISGDGDASIQGFATDISVNKGSTVAFKIKTDSTNYVLHIYRMGYYGGAGARLVADVNPSVALPQSQPSCISDAATGNYDCGNWAVSASWNVPATAVSGVYFAKLDRQDTPGSSHIFFVVRDDAGASAMLFQTTDTTWQAYNDYGGNSLYGGHGPGSGGRAYKVSYNRPFDSARVKPESWVFNAEYPMIRWLEGNGYDVSYFTGLDSDRNGALIKNHRIFLSIGHDEYWSGNQRANVEAARAAGTHLAFFSACELFWKTRWEASIDGANTSYRTLVSYKETHANAVIDPADPPTWTGTWRDPRFSPPGDGGRPENALTGNLFMVNGTDYRALTVTAADGRMRFWRNTSAASLSPGQSVSYGAGCNCVIGYEWDEDVDNGARPAGLFHLSTTTANVANLLQDYGSTYAPGGATHSLTMYRAASGALVFGAGTIGWAYALDGHSDVQPSTPDLNIEQATVNLFADMGVQPATLQPGLIAATASTDRQPPTSTITSPTAGSSIQAGTTVTISGTAADAGGGVVAGVEVSVDGGSTWHPANGRESWTYSWRAAATGQVTIKSRATDDSANIEQPSAGVTITVTPHTCPCSLWYGSVTPSMSGSSDASSVELGAKFTSDTAGYVTGVRFYKDSSNTGIHTGSLWTASGTLLGSVTFSNETASGWQQASFGSAIPVAASSIYVISYHAPNGHYSQDASYFASPYDSPPLHGPSSSASGGNGVYAYSSSSSFPTNSWNASNYWVDVVFSQQAPPPPPPPPPTCPCSLFKSSATPAAISSDPSAVELGMKFSSDTAGYISGVRFYKGSGNTGAHVGNLWSSSGTQLATATFSGETSSGWQQVSFGNAVAINANTTYVVSYHTNTGHYGQDQNYFNSAVDNAPLHAPTAGASGGNGVYVYGGSSFPTNSWNASNYWVDVVFSQQAPPPPPPPPPPTCPCSLFNSSTTPAAISSDASAVELGMKFSSDTAGHISGVRFYKGSGNTGTHVANLWNSSGTLLATATFSSETSSGWQQVSFANAVAINANTTYVVSYHTNTGHYGQDQSYFNGAVDNAPLHAPTSGASGGNGVYAYGGSSFPTSSWNASNYWVDVVFSP